MTYLPDREFLIDVAMGLYDNMSIVNKFGANPDVDSGSVPEDVWGYGGVYGFYPTAAEGMEIVSTSASDTEDIFIQGLDSSWNVISETKTLNGQTAVALDNDYIRVFRAYNTGANDLVGNVSVRMDSGAATVAAYIIAAENQTQQTIYTIPAGKTGYFLQGYVAMVDAGASRTCRMIYQVRPFGGVFQIKGEVGLTTGGNTHWQYRYQGPPPIPEKSDIRIRVTEASSADMKMVGGYDILLVDN